MEKNRCGKRERYFEHIDKYIEVPLIKNVLAGKTSLKKEIDSFYGFNSYKAYTRSGFYVDFEIVKRDCDVNNGVPSDLIEIVSPFCNRELDLDRLDYNLVRRGVGNDSMTDIVTYISMLGFGGSAIVSAALDSPVPMGVTFGFISLSALALSLVDLFRGAPEYSKSTREARCFLEGSFLADKFVKEEYLPRFVEDKF